MHFCENPDTSRVSTVFLLGDDVLFIIELTHPKEITRNFKHTEVV